MIDFNQAQLNVIVRMLYVLKELNQYHDTQLPYNAQRLALGSYLESQGFADCEIEWSQYTVQEVLDALWANADTAELSK